MLAEQDFALWHIPFEDSCMCHEHVGLLIGQSPVRLKERRRRTKSKALSIRQR